LGGGMGGLADGTKGPEVTSGDRLALLWRRGKEHRIAQWTVGYVAVAYGIQHAVTLTSEAYEWPNIILRVSMTLLALGLPVAMTLSWYHGGKANHRISGPELSILSVLLVGVSIVFFAFVRPSPEAAHVAAAIQQSGVAAARAAATSSKGEISLAVLPFVNLSGDPQQEFFSDGMTEEITTALAKIRDLRVVARESAFQFKGERKDLRAVGQSLGATHLLEGAIRREGDRLRISAQLVQASNGVDVWSENYDRQFTSVFAIQEDIATAIAGALRMPLGLKQGELLVTNRSIDPDSYEAYLRAKRLVRTRQAQQATNAVSLLENITARSPDYAPAWALLALAYDVMPQSPAWYSGAVAEIAQIARDSLPRAEAAAQRAIRLDPGLADGYASLGRLQVARGKLLPAETSYSQALALDPNNPDALQYAGNLLAEVGHLKEALAQTQRLRAVEPYVPVLNLNAAVVEWLNGENEQAIATMEELAPVAAREVDLAQIYASAGRYRDAADLLLKIPPETFFPGILPEAIRLLRSAPANIASAQNPPRLGRLGFVYLYTGVPLRALEFHESGVDAGYAIAITTAEIWHRSYAVLRKTVRFKALMRNAGIVNYWRVKGWPQQCHPTTGDDFECN
jgi:TolB-like protein/tetratricopeptide (TPR) repeat protein